MTPGGWVLVLTVAAGGIIYLYFRELQRRTGASADSEDTGSIILSFSQAYPDLPVREVRYTADQDNAFLRTASGSVGLVQVSGNHRVATLLEPHELFVEATDDERSVNLRFSRPNVRDGTFAFATVEDAAEVMLWLCGNMLPEKV